MRRARAPLAAAIQSDGKDFLSGQYLVIVASLASICGKKCSMVGTSFRGLIGALVCHVATPIVV